MTRQEARTRLDFAYIKLEDAAKALDGNRSRPTLEQYQTLRLALGGVEVAKRQYTDTVRAERERLEAGHAT